MTTMTISQALRAIKRTKGKIAELRTRAVVSVSFDQARPPNWDFEVSRSELAAEKRKLVGLETAVAVANATKIVKFEDREVPIAFAIRQLQELKDDMSFLASLSLRAGAEEHDAGYAWDAERRRDVPVKKTVTFVSRLSETERATALEQLRDRFEKLNDAVEAANHATPIRLLE